MEETSNNKLGIPFLITLLVTISIPCLYLIGYMYARAYYKAFGNAWIVQFLSFHEVLSHSMVVGTTLLMGFVLAITMAHYEFKYSKTIIFICGITAGFALLFGGLSWYSTGDYSNAMNFMLLIGLCGIMGFIGSTIADLFTALRNGDEKYLKFSIAWCLVGVFIISGLTQAIGGLSGSITESITHKKFPRLITHEKIVTGESQLFLLGIMNNQFLILEKKGKTNTFRTASNLDESAIVPPSVQEFIPVLQ
ncbi:hypothetical protein J3Q00_11375 [Pseudomonas sp. D2-3]